jgi:hypothetical protein
MELACPASLYNLDGVLDSCRLVKVVPEGFTDQGAGRCMVPHLPPWNSMSGSQPSSRVMHHIRMPLVPLLAFLSHRIFYKRIDDNGSLHPRVFQGIKSTGKQ